jgi:hypothetical protein
MTPPLLALIFYTKTKEGLKEWINIFILLKLMKPSINET